MTSFKTTTIKTALLAIAILLYSAIGTTGGEFSGGGITMASLKESVNDSEDQKQSKAKKLFNLMTNEQALVSNRFYKRYPRFYFPEADKKMLMHNACYTGGYLFAGYYKKCIDFSSELNECLETEIAPVLMAKADAPQILKVDFYRKINGSTVDQVFGGYWLGTRDIEIKSCD